MSGPPEHAHGSRPGSRPLADASVRLARPSDAPAVGHVQAVVWSEVYAALLAPEVAAAFQPPAFARAWRTSLETPPTAAHRLLVACAGEQVVGFAAVAPSGDPDATGSDGELTVLAVHPDARQLGHGSRLLNAAVDTARGSGFHALSGWLRDDDAQTRAFLTAAGFTPDGAFRDRAVGPAASDVLREVRLVATIVPQDA